MRSRPSSRTDPPSTGRRPSSASHSSVWPLPCTPATPRISPARTWNDTPSSAGFSSSPGTVRSCTSSRTSPGLGGRLGHPELNRPADHQRGQLAVAGRGRELPDHLAAADDRDDVRDLLDLFELVRDEHDGPAAGLQVPDDPEQFLGLARGEHRGGLVEDQHAGLAQQGLDDLHPLLHADRQILDQGVRVDLQAVALGQFADVAAGAPPVDPAERPGALHAEGDVFRHGEYRHQHEVLVHHADAGLDRAAGRAEVLRLAVQQDLALVRLGQPVQDVHQGGLARAVLAEQRVDLARFHGQVDVIVGHEAAEALRDPLQLQLHRPASRSVIRYRLASAGQRPARAVGAEWIE